MPFESWLFQRPRAFTKQNDLFLGKGISRIISHNLCIVPGGTCYFKVKKEGMMLKNQGIPIHLLNSWIPQISPRWVAVCFSSWIPAMESDGTVHIGKGTQGPGPARSVVQIKQFLVFLLSRSISFFLSLFYWSIVDLQCCVILLDGKVIQIYIPDI